MPRKQKALVYLTHRTADRARLLVFAHVLPEHAEAGIQIPAGTVEPDEKPQVAALRELIEETGLPESAVRLAAFLGVGMHDAVVDGKSELHYRFWFHAEYVGEEPPPERWQHAEQTPGDSTPGPIPLEFYWVDLPDGVPPLAGKQDIRLPSLLKRLGLGGEE